MRRRILVVDDHQPTADTLQMFFELEGYEVAIAYDGEQALEVAERFSPDIVLLDINLPKMNGREVAVTMRQLSPQTRVDFIAVTGLDNDEDRISIAEAGFLHHLVKPVDPNQLRDLLASLSMEAA